MNKLITGGLIGFAIILASLQSILWPVHALAGAVSVLGMAAGTKIKILKLVPVITLIAVWLVAWA